MDYRRELANFTTPVKLQVATETPARGNIIKTYTDSDEFNCSWKQKGGTEITSNGVLMIEDTAEITCWYNPNIKANSRLINKLNNLAYEVIGTPENVDNMNKFMKFKVRKVTGGR